MQLRRFITLLSLALLIFASSVAFGASFNPQANQTSPAKPVADTLSGKYEGIAKTDQGDLPLTIEIKNDNGKLSGMMDSSLGQFPLTGTYADGKVVMKLSASGSEITVNAMVSGEKISGKWEMAGQGGALELKRAVAAAATTPAPSTTMAAPAGDPISGEWNASAEVQGSTIPFTLKLKLEGDKVTGTSESDQGVAPLSKGMWSANNLSFALDTPNGVIGFKATIKEGKLVGEFDFAGQMTGKWEAKKK